MTSNFSFKNLLHTATCYKNCSPIYKPNYLISFPLGELTDCTWLLVHESEVFNTILIFCICWEDDELIETHNVLCWDLLLSFTRVTSIPSEAVATEQIQILTHYHHTATFQFSFNKLRIINDIFFLQ